VFRAGLMQVNRGEEAVVVAIDEQVMDIEPHVMKRVSALWSLANIATLFGLLGTMLGLIHTFEALDRVADPGARQQALARGISEAMNNTALGLGIAVTCMTAHLLLQRCRLKNIVQDVQLTADEAHQPAHARPPAVTARKGRPRWHTEGHGASTRSSTQVASPKELWARREGGELNIVPFLDIIVNVLMFVLATIATIFTATIPVPAPGRSNSGGPGRAGERLNITVKITPRGYIVGAGGGFLLPGCSTVGQATLRCPTARRPTPRGTPTTSRPSRSACRASGAVRGGGPGRRRAQHQHLGELDDPLRRARRDHRRGARELDPARAASPRTSRAADYSAPECMFPEVTLGVLQLNR
jgi:hypothetical protein